jgi:hypothetical protein
MMVLQLLFVWLLMPETKGKTLEELEVELGLSTEELNELKEDVPRPGTAQTS